MRDLPVVCQRGPGQEPMGGEDRAHAQQLLRYPSDSTLLAAAGEGWLRHI